MANINDVINMITNESLRILHQKLNFVTNIVTEYDDSYAQSGAKIGDSLRVRLPIRYTSGTGATMATGTGADSISVNTTLQVNNQIHVPLRFTTAELAQDIDYLQKRHLEPAMAQLAADIENDAFSMLNSVANTIEAGTKVVFDDVMHANQRLFENLAPLNNWYCITDPVANRDLVVDNKALFHDQAELSRQYKEGRMGVFGDFEFYRNSLIPTHTSGAAGGSSAYLTNAVTAQEKTLSASDNDPTTGSLIVDTGTATIKAGDVFTIANVFDVHPETKQSTGVLKQFTVTADATGAGTLSISPALIASGPHQNSSTAAANNSALTFIGAASTAYKQSVAFQKGFAAFATTDLVKPDGVHYCSRQVYDGISMRILSDYDVVKDRLYTRCDVLYGYKVLRPELAVKIHHT